MAERHCGKGQMRSASEQLSLPPLGVASANSCERNSGLPCPGRNSPRREVLENTENAHRSELQRAFNLMLCLELIQPLELQQLVPQLVSQLELQQLQEPLQQMRQPLEPQPSLHGYDE